MQVDTGSPVCVIAEETYRRRAHFWPKLEPTDKTLYCYTGKLPLSGVFKLVVNNPTGETEGELYVTKCSGPSLCGRDIIQKLNILGQRSITFFVQVDSSVQETVTNLKRGFSNLFPPGTGLMKELPAQAHINLKKEVNPKFFKARSLPYDIRDKVARELDRLCEEGILSPVTHSEWAAPVVPVLKADVTLRLCGHFKVTLNAECEVDQYPPPKVKDIFANLKDGY